jgi:hypothetical protein
MGIVTCVARVSKGWTRSHLTIVVVVAGRALWRLRAIAHATWSLRSRACEDRVIGMCLDVLLEILGTLEGLAAELALVRLEGYMNTDMRGDVIALDGGGAARVPLARKAQVVCALAANMALADVFLKSSVRVSKEAEII